jgi:parvulin-like peptidyl-prolyl isomerase
VDGIEAQVNSEVITTSDLERRAGPAIAALGFTGAQKEASAKAIRRKELEKLVLERLKTQAAAKAKTHISEREVEKRFKEQVKQAGSVPKMLRILSNEGMTLGQFREGIERDVRFENFFYGRLFGSPDIPQVYDIDVTPEELRAHYRGNLEKYRQPEEAKVRHVFLSVERGGAAAARELAVQVHGELIRGADMAKLAKQYNPGEQGRLEGDLDWIRRDSSFCQAIRDFAFSHPEGSLSEPLEQAGVGFFIVRVEGRREERVLGFEEVQQKIRQELRETKVHKVFDELHEELVRDAYIWPPDLFPNKSTKR